jgi:HKD family nuclease
MARAKVVFQGVEADVFTREIIEEIITLTHAEKIVICSAFVQQTGVEDLSEALSKCFCPPDVYIGINNGITSFESIVSLLRRKCTVFSVDTGITGAIFHPKVFCSYNKFQAKVLVGSSNLTFSGLNNNIECGLFLDLDMRDPGDKAVIENIITGIENLRYTYPKSIIHINSDEKLLGLWDAKLLETEIVSREKSRRGEGENGPKMALPLRKPRLIKEKILPPDFEDRAEKMPEQEVQAGKNEIVQVHRQHVWTKKNLSDTDAQIPKTPTSNPKGCISLTKSGFIGPNGQLINQTKYFRYDVFGDLEWKYNKSKDRDEAFANFELIIGGESKGKRTLMISHKASREADQNNYTTALHISYFTGDFPKAKGKNLKLFKIASGQFMIEIL